MRLVLELDHAASEALSQLEVSTGMSVSRIFSCALSLMLWAFGQGAKGRIVASVDESQRSYRELELATLEQKQSCAA
jgi:hypothetical protein